MFNGYPQGASQIAQGATLFIFDRKKFDLYEASVQSVSQPHVPKAAQTNPSLAFQGFVIDLSLAVGGDTTTIEFPVNSASANYQEKGWFVTTDRLAASREIEAAVNTAAQTLAQRPMLEAIVNKGPELLMKVHPERRVEAQQAEKIAALERQIASMDAAFNGKLDRLVSILSSGHPANTATPVNKNGTLEN